MNIISYIFSFIFVIILFLVSFFSPVKVTDDIKLYNDVIGYDAKDEYEMKWGMDESIFPSKITDDMNVIDFKMVYYDPWDAQYLSYLVVDYDEENYKNEVERLTDYGIEEYRGYYGVTGFTNYKLLAMEADSYNGFVYAITDNERRIIYVELIFCNYFYDIDYKKYINNDYLPDGFDATLNNPYSREMD